MTTMKSSKFLFCFSSFLFVLLLFGSSTHQYSIDLPEDRKFVFGFFQYFTHVRSQLSEDCLAVSDYFRNHSSDEWAARVIDSNSLIEPGLAYGNLQYLGSFDECIHVRVPPNAMASQLSNHAIQYCTVNFPTSMILTKNEPLAGICLPAACNSSDITTILNKCKGKINFAKVTKICSQDTQITNISVSLNANSCVTEEGLSIRNRLHSSHIVIITILSLILLLCIVGTVVECEFPKHKESNWIFKFAYCFSLKRNFKFLFQTSKLSSTKNSPKVPTLSKLSSTTSAPSSISIDTLDSPISEGKMKCDLVLSSNLSLNASTAHIIPPDNSTTTQEERIQTTSELAKSEIKLIRPQIECLHGIRFVSFVFILIYHTFTEAQTPSVNLVKVIDAERNFVKQLITNAALWVDTFFLLSGFLVAHSLLYQKPSSTIWSHLVQHPKRLLHRYLRLTPSVAAVLMLSILIEPLGSGPVWYQYVATSQSTCHQNWWTCFLYVNNIFKLNQPGQYPSQCLPYLWYLAVDMQFYLISPILVMFLTHKSFRMQFVGICVNILVTLASFAITAALMASNGLTPTLIVTVYDLPYINMVYMTAYCRIGPYCLGILLAYVLYRQAVAKSLTMEKTEKPSQMYGLALLFVSLGLVLTVTMLTYPWLHGADYHNVASVLYGTCHRTVWALGWALFIYACVNGHLRVVNHFLGFGLFQFLSKLTYQSYLLHSVLIRTVTSSVRQKIYYSDVNFMLDIYKYLILTITVSVGTFVTFERPFINLEQTFVKW